MNKTKKASDDEAFFLLLFLVLFQQDRDRDDIA